MVRATKARPKHAHVAKNQRHNLTRQVDLSKGEIQCPFIRQYSPDSAMNCCLIAGHMIRHQDHRGGTWGNWVKGPKIKPPSSKNRSVIKL